MRITKYKVILYNPPDRSDPRIVIEMEAQDDYNHTIMHKFILRNQAGFESATPFTDLVVYPNDVDVKTSLLNALAKQDSSGQFIRTEHQVAVNGSWSTGYDEDLTGIVSINIQRWRGFLDVVQTLGFSTFLPG
jgi:hypothetical protein